MSKTEREHIEDAKEAIAKMKAACREVQEAMRGVMAHNQGDEEKARANAAYITLGEFESLAGEIKQAHGRAFVRFECEQVLARKGHRSAGHFIARPPAKHIAQRRFARAVRPHDCVDFARVDGQRQAFEDRLVGHGGMEVSDLEHG